MIEESKIQSAIDTLETKLERSHELHDEWFARDIVIDERMERAYKQTVFVAKYQIQTLKWVLGNQVPPLGIES
jgi:hypothetical protein